MSLRRKALRRLVNDDGAEVVEFAIIAPILLLLIVGLIAFGFAFMSQITVTQSAREGARYVAICKTSTSCVSGVTAKVIARSPGLDADNLQVDVIQDCTVAGTEDARVVVTYLWDVPFSPFGALTLHGKASTPCGG